MKVYEGNLVAPQGGAGSEGRRLGIALVAARFNELITSKLVSGALDALKRHGVTEDAVSLAWVPGAFEIPLAAQKLAAKPEIGAVICLGAVIRGSTPHFDYVASEVAKGTAQVSLASGKPVIFGVLTTDTIEQAIERAGTKAGNKGFEAAITAIEMINVLNKINIDT